ncbi:E3 ubiquitin-protein ligase RLIM-like [Argopecten irradians]|uniref:E3 ubiquitin-protein ligase RLIM-like n=1 Tax=Argopecten irradians TaxID=31199 RepID=UPI003714AF31
MDSEEPAVRPKTGQSNRPYSVSKDEAYARMLQREEDSLAMNSDEDFARQLQEELNMEERRKFRESMSNRLPMRAMTPITQLFSTLVGRRLNPNISDEESDNENNSEENDNSDSDSTLSGATASTTSNVSTATGISERRGSNTTTSPRSGVTTRGRNRGTTRPTRGLHGMRPTETGVTDRSTTGPTRGRGVTRGTSRGRRGQVTGRGATATSRSSRSTQGASSSTENNESAETRITGNRRSIPRSMEPIAPPLSLAINQPELPDGEMEPEIILLDRGESEDPDDRYVRIMRDPILLLMFLMGRAPHLMVPDDVDANDYESLWQLAEEVGEVKSRGLEDKDLKSLTCRLYNKRTKVSSAGESQAECRVCLTSYTAGDSICTLPCKGKHEFHEKCVKEWLKRNASCPICRFELKKS